MEDFQEKISDMSYEELLEQREELRNRAKLSMNAELQKKANALRFQFEQRHRENVEELLEVSKQCLAILQEEDEE